MLTSGAYILSNNDQEYLNHCILVKLTDTSVKYIHEFIKRNDTTKKTILKFIKDKGEISFSNQDCNSIKGFQFSLSSIKGSNKDATASFECVSYNNKRLESINSIEEKITVHATDEAFQATKEKVSIVAEEEKKNSAIEIKSSNTNNRTNRPSKNINNNKSIKKIEKSPIYGLNSITTIIQKNRESINDNGNINLKIQNKIINESKAKNAFENPTIQLNQNSPSKKQIDELVENIDNKSNIFKLSPLQENQVDIILNLKNTPKNSKNINCEAINNSQKIDQEIKSFWDSDFHDLTKYDKIFNIKDENDKKNKNECSAFDNKSKHINSDICENYLKLYELEHETDYLRLRKINTLEERIKIKDLFDKLYPEYIKLFNFMEPINKKFSDYKEKIQQSKNNPKEYQYLYDHIIKEYSEIQNDKTFCEKNERYNKIYSILEHFYNLIKTFDDDYDNNST